MRRSCWIHWRPTFIASFCIFVKCQLHAKPVSQSPNNYHVKKNKRLKKKPMIHHDWFGSLTVADKCCPTVAVVSFPSLFLQTLRHHSRAFLSVRRRRNRREVQKITRSFACATRCLVGNKRFRGILAKHFAWQFWATFLWWKRNPFKGCWWPPTRGCSFLSSLCPPLSRSTMRGEKRPTGQPRIPAIEDSEVLHAARCFFFNLFTTWQFFVTFLGWLSDPFNG